MAKRVLARELLSQFPLLDRLFRRFIWSRVHFPEVEMRFLDAVPPGSIDVAVDVGAAMGAYSWILSRVSEQVYAFEPGVLYHRHLSHAVFGTNITVVRAAVGSVCGRVSLYTPGSDSNALHSATVSQGNPVVTLAGTNVDQVDQVTLDAFLGERLTPGRTVDLLKVDVEGYELEVFKGCLGILSKHHPLIICEIEARHNANYADAFHVLREMGYRCYFFRGGMFESFGGERIEELQPEDDLKARIDGDYDPNANRYVNNFVFQHSLSRVKVR